MTTYHRDNTLDYDLDEADEDDEIYYFYDDETNFRKLRLRDMSGVDHEFLKTYLVDLMRWLFWAEKWAVYPELNFYETANPNEEPLYPDVALIKNQPIERGMSSYRIGVKGPAPHLIIELISTNTRGNALYSKPARYAKWGTAEYFVYDPRPRKRKHNMQRLWGWRLNKLKGYDPIQPDLTGKIWSQQLESWLIPDGEYLRLEDINNKRRLTQLEALEQENIEERKRTEQAKAQIEQERLQAVQQIEQERLRTEQERLRAEKAEAQIQQERLRAEQERAKNEQLAQMLRDLGYNPDEPK